ncbi:hypothetical protein [Vibrio coralliilyticus]
MGYLLYMNEPSMTKKQENEMKVKASGKDTQALDLKPIGHGRSKGFL